MPFIRPAAFAPVARGFFIREIAMSEPLKSIHVRVDPAVHAALKVMAQANKIEVAQMVEEIVRESVLGKFHVLKVAVEEMRRLGIEGISRD